MRNSIACGAVNQWVWGLLLCVFLTPVLAEPGAPASDLADTGATKRLMVLGDSLSAAYNLPLTEGWVHLLRNRLENRFPKKFTVVNASISGATTAAGLASIPTLLKEHQPHLVIIELGGNDGLQGKPIASITHNLEQLISQSKNAGAEVMLVGIRIPPNLGKRYTEPFFEQYRTLAQKHELPLVPFLLEGVATVPELMQRDGIHPNAKAQAQLLDNVWLSLAPWVQEAASGAASATSEDV